MKKILAFATAAMISYIAFTGCTKSSTTSGYYMVASLGGTVTYFNNSTVSIANNSVTGAQTYIIEGLNNASNYPYVYLYLPSKDTGTYAIGGYSNSTHAIFATDTLTTKQSVSGTVHIDTVSSFISGTFNFTCTDGTTISSGVFHAKMF